MKVYIYKQFFDGTDYGNERIAVYNKREDAVEQLKSYFEIFSGTDLKIEDIRNEDILDFTIEECKEDYIRVEGTGGYYFWVIEEHSVN